MESNDTVVVVGFVGHCSIDDLSRIKKDVERVTGLRVILFKTSSQKLWLKEGEP